MKIYDYVVVAADDGVILDHGKISAEDRDGAIVKIAQKTKREDVNVLVREWQPYGEPTSTGNFVTYGWFCHGCNKMHYWGDLCLYNTGTSTSWSSTTDGSSTTFYTDYNTLTN